MAKNVKREPNRLERAETALKHATKTYVESPTYPHKVALDRATVEVNLARFDDRFGHRRATAETLAKFEAIPPRRRNGSLARMALLGKITADELQAGEQIARAAEILTRGIGCGSPSFEPRIDNGSRADLLIESMGMAVLQGTYTRWRDSLPTPKAMILDMLVNDRPYVAVARAHGINYRAARKMMITALRRWNAIAEDVREKITSEDIEVIRAGELFRRAG